MKSSGTEGATGRPGLYKWVVLFILTWIYAQNYLDRQLVAVLSEPIRKEMHLSDTQLGLITGSIFAMFYVTAAVPISLLADRGSRVKVVGIACALWSAFTAIFGLGQNFIHLAAARIGVALGEAGA